MWDPYAVGLIRFRIFFLPFPLSLMQNDNEFELKTKSAWERTRGRSIDKKKKKNSAHGDYSEKSFFPPSTYFLNYGNSGLFSFVWHIKHLKSVKEQKITLISKRLAKKRCKWSEKDPSFLKGFGRWRELKLLGTFWLDSMTESN